MLKTMADMCGLRDLIERPQAPSKREAAEPPTSVPDAVLQDRRSQGQHIGRQNF